MGLVLIPMGFRIVVGLILECVFVLWGEVAVTIWALAGWGRGLGKVLIAISRRLHYLEHPIATARLRSHRLCSFEHPRAAGRQQHRRLHHFEYSRAAGRQRHRRLHYFEHPRATGRQRRRRLHYFEHPRAPSR